MVDTQNLVGQGAKMAMDEIYRMLFGNAFVNARQGQPVTAGDIGDTAFTVGLNSLPFGAGGGVVRGAQAAPAAAKAVDEALARKILQNAIAQRKVAVAMTPSGAEGTIRSGGMKNIFELDDVAASRPGTYLGERRLVEENLLGIPQSAPAAARPTYGALAGPMLPQPIAQRLPGVTGQAIRVLDPRFNKVLSKYGYTLGSNTSEVTPALLATTRPGIEGTATIADSFLDPARAYSLTNKADAQQLSDDVFELISRNARNKYGGENQLALGSSQTYPYLEVQMAPGQGALSNISKMQVPVNATRSSPYGNNPDSARAQAQALQQFLKQQGVSNVKAGKIQQIQPDYITSIQRGIAQARASAPVRAANRAAYNVSQIPSKVRSKLQINRGGKPIDDIYEGVL